MTTKTAAIGNIDIDILKNLQIINDGARTIPTASEDVNEAK